MPDRNNIFLLFLLTSCPIIEVISKETFLSLLNKTGHSLNTTVSEVDDDEWNGDNRPDQNFDGLTIEPDGETSAPEEINDDASASVFTLKLSFDDDREVSCRIDQRLALGDPDSDEVLSYFGIGSDIVDTVGEVVETVDDVLGGLVGAIGKIFNFGVKTAETIKEINKDNEAEIFHCTGHIIHYSVQFHSDGDTLCIEVYD